MHQRSLFYRLRTYIYIGIDSEITILYIALDTVLNRIHNYEGGT